MVTIIGVLIFGMICPGVKYDPIVGWDLKPENILIDYELVRRYRYVGFGLLILVATDLEVDFRFI